MLRDKEDDKRDKYGEVHVGRDDFRIEVVGFDGMDKRYHSDTGKHDRKSAISIAEDQDGHSRDKCPKNRDKSTDKDDEWDGKNKWKWFFSVKKTDRDKSYSRQDSIHESDKGLCLENKSKSRSDFLRDHSPLVVEKSEVPISYLGEEFFDPFSINDKKIREDKSDEKFRKEYPRICHVVKCIFPDRLQIIAINDIRCYGVETEVEIGALLYFRYEILSLGSDFWWVREEAIELSSDLREDVDEDKYQNPDKNNIEKCDHDVCCSVSFCYTVGSILFPSLSPGMYACGEPGTEFEKDVGKKKCHKKEYEEVSERVSEDEEDRVGDHFFPEDFSEDERDKGFECHGK